MIKKAKQPSFTYNIPALAKTTKVSMLFFIVLIDCIDLVTLMRKTEIDSKTTQSLYCKELRRFSSILLIIFRDTAQNNITINAVSKKISYK